METTLSSETSVNIYNSRMGHIPENSGVLMEGLPLRIINVFVHNILDIVHSRQFFFTTTLDHNLG
jgi:hypothetical protein